MVNKKAMKWIGIALISVGVLGIVLTYFLNSNLKNLSSNWDRELAMMEAIVEGASNGENSDDDLERADTFVTYAANRYRQGKNYFNISLVATIVILAGGVITYRLRIQK